MSSEVTKSKVLSSLFWKLLERGGTQSIQFILTIIFARLLLPREFGLIVLVTIFVSIAGIFVQSGFNTALIQKKDADELDLSSVFYLSIFVAIILYFTLFFSAPFIATFFNQPEFISVLRILSITLFFGSFNSIQIAIISRNMQFKKLFLSSLVAIIISGILGISLAYANFGVWALVSQQLANQLIITVVLWFTVSWRPLFVFSIKRIIDLFSYGWKLLVSALLNTLSANFQSLVVGKIFSPAMLGFYNRGEQFPSFIVGNIDGSIQSVMLPTLSSYQDDKQRVKEIVRRSVVTSAFIIFPMMVGLAVIAEPLVKLILTEKWLPSVPFLQIFCFSYALLPIHTANLQAMNALGRSDLFLKLEITKKLLSFAILGVSIPFGIYGIVWGGFISSLLSTFINAYPNRKLIDYSYHEQWRDIIPSLVISIVMGGIVYTLNWLNMTEGLTLIIQVITGIISYIGIARIFKLECYMYLLINIKDMFRSKKKTKIINYEV
ncbi:lipopolysaccharide biosynthesis protein [Rummeliibacillus pycnus]|uniref:lipopolysaccharide biosynthesis protein n=1 Tax=Rummeliibacillus pycnus TaxID=101070 RepID=UPI003D27AF5C